MTYLEIQFYLFREDQYEYVEKIIDTSGTQLKSRKISEVKSLETSIL